MGNMLLGPHWCPSHVGQEDDKFMVELQPSIFKIFSQGDDFPRLDVALRAIKPGGLIVLRHHPTSENYGERGLTNVPHAQNMARRHYEFLMKMIPPGINDKIAMEGLNEPRVWPWGDEPIPLVIEYYSHLAKLFFAHGIRTVFMNLSVGWPGNGEPVTPPGTIPDWRPYLTLGPIIKAYKGYLGLHEYWYLNGPKDPWIEPNGKKFGGWGWWAGRHLSCPLDVEYLITEAGIDSNVLKEGTYFGFHGLDPSLGSLCVQYFEQLKAYEAQCLAGGRVKGITPFLYDFYDPQWAPFDMRTDECRQLWLARSKEDIKIPEKWSLPSTWNLTPMPVPIPVPNPVPVPSFNNVMKWTELAKKYALYVDFRVILTIISLESNGDPNAVNKDSGATGLMQVMPKSVKFPNRPTKEELLNPEFNVQWGCSILLGNLEYYKNATKQLPRALSAYYGGYTAGDNLTDKRSKLYLDTFESHWQKLFNIRSPYKGFDPTVLAPEQEKIKHIIKELEDLL